MRPKPKSSTLLKHLAYSTAFEFCLQGKAEDILKTPEIADPIQEKVDLIFTSPPFPLNRKKKYGNLKGDAYMEWLASFADIFKNLLKPNLWIKSTLTSALFHQPKL